MARRPASSGGRRTRTRCGSPSSASRKQLLTRGGAISQPPAASMNVRIPGGHPEGYLEAFATLYSQFAAVIRGDGKAYRRRCCRRWPTASKASSSSPPRSPRARPTASGRSSARCEGSSAAASSSTRIRLIRFSSLRVESGARAGSAIHVDEASRGESCATSHWLGAVEAGIVGDEPVPASHDADGCSIAAGLMRRDAVRLNGMA